MAKRRIFTSEFKVEAVRLVSERGVSVAQAAKIYQHAVGLGWEEASCEIDCGAFVLDTASMGCLTRIEPELEPLLAHCWHEKTARRRFLVTR